MYNSKFFVGQKVKRAKLRPFEIDFIVPKVYLATGQVHRIWTINYKSNDGFYWRYEVIWLWPNGESCIGHYNETELTAQVTWDQNKTHQKQ